jgi:hypothetical protein
MRCCADTNLNAHRWSSSDQRLPEHSGVAIEDSETQSSEQQNSPDHEGSTLNLSSAYR